MTLAAQKEALLSWFASSAGITAIWANDGSPRPAYPYGVLNIIGDSVAAEDYRWEHNQDLPAGEDMELTIRQDREIVLSCQCWTKPGSYDSTAHHHLDLARRSLAFPSVLRALHSEGIAVAQRLTNILDISSEVNGQRLMGAAMDVMLNVATTAKPVTERSSYIDEVQGEVALETPPNTISIHVDAR